MAVIQGTSLIEVLVALLVMTSGFMGLSGLTAKALKTKLESYQRLEALLVVEEIANNLRVNPQCLTTTDPATACMIFSIQKTGLQGMRTCITHPVTGVFIITIAWQGLFDSFVPLNPCGHDTFGSEEKRRVVSTVVSYATE